MVLGYGDRLTQANETRTSRGSRWNGNAMDKTILYFNIEKLRQKITPEKEVNP